MNRLGKYSGALVFLKPAAPGTGVIAGGAMRAVLGKCRRKRCAGKIKRILQSSQCSQSYHQCTGENERSAYHCTITGVLN